jgi:hypothetical protein
MFKLINSRSSKINVVFLLFSIAALSCSNPEKSTDGLAKDFQEEQTGVFDSRSRITSKNTQEANLVLLADRTNLILTPFVINDATIPTSSRDFLIDRLTNAVAQGGQAGFGSNPRFIVGPKVSVLNTQVTATSPPKYLVELSVSFLVADVQTQRIFNTVQYELKGVGASEEAAILTGLRSIDFGVSLSNFFTVSKAKIVDYFNENCEAIIKEAEKEGDLRHFAEAFSILKSIPMESSTCQEKIREKLQSTFRMSLNAECERNLTLMKSELGKYNDNTGGGYNDAAMFYFSLIDPQADCYPDAQKLYLNYVGKLNPTGRRDWEFKLEQYRNALNHDLEVTKMNMEYQVKLQEIEARKVIEGNQKLLAKYKYDESPWLVRVFSSFSKLNKGEMATD